MIYFDNAATSFPKPKGVADEVLHTILERGGNPGRGGHDISLAAAEVIYEARRAVISFLGGDEEENVVFTQNATYAINTILRARARRGSHIIMSDMEHNAVRRPVLQLAREGIATYSIFSTEGVVIENILPCLKPGDNILICTHVSNVNGMVLPLDKISRLCLENKVFFIVDASQSLGHIPYDISHLPCDALCAPGHKGLMGIQGCGILYIKDKEPLNQVFSGGSGADSLSPHMPLHLPDRYEAGTLPTPAIAGLLAGIRFINEVGIETIASHIQALSHFLYRELKNHPHFELFSKADSQILAFRIKGKGSEEVARRLNNYGICVRGGHHCAPLAHQTLGTTDGGLVRVSPGFFSSMEECVFLLECLDHISKAV